MERDSSVRRGSGRTVGTGAQRKDGRTYIAQTEIGKEH
jgi:hypothetical protein